MLSFVFNLILFSGRSAARCCSVTIEARFRHTWDAGSPFARTLGSNKMTMIRTGLLAATVVAGITGIAQAAPLGAIGDAGTAIKAEAASNTESVHLQCWRHRGHLHCSRRHAHHFYWDTPRRHLGWYSWRRWH
jgi:hypothetical protein